MSVLTMKAAGAALDIAQRGRFNSKSDKGSAAAHRDANVIERQIIAKRAAPGDELAAKLDALRVIHKDDLAGLRVSPDGSLICGGRRVPKDDQLHAAINSILQDVFG